MKMVIPRKILSLNKWQRMHWARRVDEKTTWVYEILTARHGKGLFNKVRKSVQITVYLKRLYDRDNILLKPVLDALTKTNLIIDDSEKWIELMPIKQIKGEPKVEIEIKDIPLPGHEHLTVQENQR